MAFDGEQVFMANGRVTATLVHGYRLAKVIRSTANAGTLNEFLIGKSSRKLVSTLILCPSQTGPTLSEAGAHITYTFRFLSTPQKRDYKVTTAQTLLTMWQTTSTLRLSPGRTSGPG